MGGSATHAPSSLVTDAPDAALGVTVVDETALDAPDAALGVTVVDETALPDAALGVTVVDETALALRTEAPSMALCVMERKRRRGTLRLLSTTPIAVHGQAGESLRARAPDEGGHRHAIGEATGRWQSGYNQFTIRLQSDVNQTSIRWQSDGNQMAIIWQSYGNQVVSDGNQMAIRWRSDAIRRQSDCNQIAIRLPRARIIACSTPRPNTRHDMQKLSTCSVPLLPSAVSTLASAAPTRP